MPRGGHGNGGDTGANAFIETNGNDGLNGFGPSFVLRRGRGDEIYYVDEPNNGGTDRAISRIDYSLGRQVENLTLDGNGSGAGGTVIGSLGAVESNRKERFSFSLVDDAGGRFVISGSNKLAVAGGADLDYESATFHTIVVRVTDEHGNTFDETITIYLNNHNEAANTAPSDISRSNTTIDETSSGGTVIGNLSNDDPDSGDSWTYTITQDLDQKFQIVGNRLVLRDGASLDYEAKGARSVTIRVTDCSGASHTETFAITFNDVAEGNSGALRRAFYARRALSALVTL